MLMYMHYIESVEIILIVDQLWNVHRFCTEHNIGFYLGQASNQTR